MPTEYTLAPGLEWISELDNGDLLISYSDGRYCVDSDGRLEFATSVAVMPTGSLLTMPDGSTIALAMQMPTS